MSDMDERMKTSEVFSFWLFFAVGAGLLVIARALRADAGPTTAWGVLLFGAGLSFGALLTLTFRMAFPRDAHLKGLETDAKVEG